MRTTRPRTIAWTIATKTADTPAVRCIDPEPAATVNADQYRRELTTRMAKLRADFQALVEAEPDVADVTTAASAPGNESQQRAEVEHAADTAAAAIVYVNRIAEDFFDAFDAPMLTGRRLTTADISGDAVVVNRAFVQRVLGGGDALGRRFSRS